MDLIYGRGISIPCTLPGQAVGPCFQKRKHYLSRSKQLFKIYSQGSLFRNRLVFFISSAVEFRFARDRRVPLLRRVPPTDASACCEVLAVSPSAHLTSVKMVDQVGALRYT
ncbi:hypothetical protein J6590_054205 [Homalodisca vitripennis]|nr:hypothetical protein J6590_054205 [Homalodisca vitripennis]